MKLHQLNKSLKKELIRKSIHMSSLWIPVAIFFLPTLLSQFIFITLLALDLSVEYAHFKKQSWLRKKFGKIFSFSLRNNELNHAHFRPSGAFYMLAAAFLCCLFFPKIISMIAMSVLIISDTCAALCGKYFGQRKIRRKKSLEGCFAFFVSALIIMMIYNPMFNVTHLSIIACMMATGVELFADFLKVDDNLSIPLSVGIILCFAL